MANISGINIDGNIVQGALSGIGDLAGKLRTAITGDVSPEKKMELEQLALELENKVELSRLSVMATEAASQDKWTSRARPGFLYVMYIFILCGIPMGVLSSCDPQTATNIGAGVGAWLKAIPADMWVLFGAGYLGYVGARTYDKKITSK